MTNGEKKTGTKVKRNLDKTKKNKTRGFGSKVWGATKAGFMGFSGVMAVASGYLFKVGAAILILGMLLEVTGLGVVALLAILAGTYLLFGGIYNFSEIAEAGKSFLGKNKEPAIEAAA